MPVVKIDGETLRKNRLPFDIIPRESVEAIESGDALAIWTYLMTRPENWIVRRDEVMKRLKIGRDRYAKAMQELNRLGLIVSASVQGKDGKMQGRVLWVNPTPTTKQPNIQVSDNSVPPNIQVSEYTEIPTFGKSAHIKNKRSNKEQERVEREVAQAPHPSQRSGAIAAPMSGYGQLPSSPQKKAASKRGTRLPDDWQPSPKDIEFCRRERPDLDVQKTAEAFRDYWVAQPGQKGVKLDWSATWRNWVRKERRRSGWQWSNDIAPQYEVLN